MTKATYSVIIPTYNRPSFLLRALKSVEKQIIKPKEVFIVDNHPFGINKFIFDKAKSSFNLNIHYLRFNSKGGALGARNYAAKFSKSKFIAFLDDDDFWSKHYISEALKKLNDSNSKLNICEYNVVDKFCKKIYKFNIPTNINVETLFRWNPGILCSNIIIENKTFNKIKMFDTNIHGSADKEILIKCIKRKIKYSVLKKSLVNWTSHENQWTKNHYLILKGVNAFNKKYFKEMTFFSKLISLKKLLTLKIKIILN